MILRLLIFLCSFTLFSQPREIHLLNEDDLSPLPFVEVNVNGDIYFSDKNGLLKLSKTNHSQEILILDDNYSPNKVTIEDNATSILLQFNSTELEEIIISQKALTKIKYLNKKIYDQFFIAPDLRLFHEVTFNKSYEDKKLKSISFKTVPQIYSNDSKNTSFKEYKSKKKDIRNTTQLFKVMIYDKYKNLLYSSKPYEYIIKNRSEFVIYINDTDIIITAEPIFIEIQVIGALNSKGEFINDNPNLSIRPKQTKLRREEYSSRVFKKILDKENTYLDYSKDLRAPYSYIDFSFELE